MPASYELLATVELATDSASVTITNIPAGYRLLRLNGRIKTESQYGQTRMVYNQLTTGKQNRATFSWYNAGGGTTNTGNNSGDPSLPFISQSNYSTNAYDYFESVAFYYNSGRGLAWQTFWTGPYIQNTIPGGGFGVSAFQTNTNLTSLALNASGGNMKAGTTIQLWGLGA